MATFVLHNFGCRASQADGAALKRQLLDAGLTEGNSARESEIAVLNTCTVTAAADAEVRQLIRRIHRENPACRILVTGCYAQRAPQELAALAGVTWVVGNSHKHLAVEVLKANPATRSAHQALETVVVGEAKRVANSQEGDPDAAVRLQPANGFSASARVLWGAMGDEFHFAPVFPDDRTRPILKVQDGCNAHCAFCIIPTVRGRSRSLPAEKVVEEVRRLEAAGYREVVLSGINLGSYGRDWQEGAPPGTLLVSLLERILATTGIQRLRISSVEPMDVTPALIALVAREPRMAKHFHVPLQSGCDRILRRMNRRYWTDQYAERILAIHEQIPGCGIGADIMAGFPEETEADHVVSLRFVESLPFTYGHVFPYSARPGTPAASREQVNSSVIHRRAEEIRQLLAAKHRSFLEGQVGQTLSVLTLDRAESAGCLALSSNYLKVLLPEACLEPNVLCDVTIGGIRAGLLYGHVAAARASMA
jgi:threonylcarbamoyladenosine tRNA methylthiotransferase MtaB